METQEKKSITEKIIDGFKNAVTEVEELRVQAALGKAEAKDLYEESKKKLNLHIHEARVKLNGVKTKTTDEALKIKAIFESLQVQLALGKAETKEVFEEQSKQILKVLNQLETEIKQNETANEYYNKLLLEIEKFKIKLTILKLRYELRKIDVKDEFEEKKKQFLGHLNEVKTRLIYKEEKEKHRWEHFQGELSEAYKHLKNVFEY